MGMSHLHDIVHSTDDSGSTPNPSTTRGCEGIANRALQRRKRIGKAIYGRIITKYELIRQLTKFEFVVEENTKFITIRYTNGPIDMVFWYNKACNIWINKHNDRQHGGDYTEFAYTVIKLQSHLRFVHKV